MFWYLTPMDGDNKRLSRHETLDSNVTKNTRKCKNAVIKSYQTKTREDGRGH